MKSITTFALAAALMLGAPVSAQLTDGEPLAIATSYTVKSDILGGERKLTVRLPTEYQAEPERRFPVVYLLDGGPEQDFIHIAGIAHSREMNFSFEPFILVGIESVNRRHWFAPLSSEPELYAELMGAEPGGTFRYRDFLRSEIKPLVEATFRTNGHDAVIGESLAALFVVETLLEEPTLFDDYIAISPSMWFENMKYGIEARDYLAKLPAGERRLYLTVANEGEWHREGLERLVDALRDRAPADLKWTFVPADEQETHGTVYHPMALDAFRMLYPTPTREYKGFGRLSDIKNGKRTAEEEARLEQECTLENSRATTPGAVAKGRDRLYYECLVLELGPTPREGTLGK
ncbi:alpha/beta hydrolase-fold protein [Altererythrobacter arenosus]|uniref:Alpha/beta hydrolase-fold protein n=1 Tax=Altererythrobacter arenosus TaxID=3032592 RepID=A0ABY8FTB8_9SPHN|nr:alpha/beta hydrolase-fold protein [Altererythrobacter sp. CAU 1644]WFL78007.1 alpha/beta hydrolase-fold protein [Altererythrobacter sp. CAU 1644]